MTDKDTRTIKNLPLVIIAGYLAFTIFLFIISPMFPTADNKYYVIAYGFGAIACFLIGYRFFARRLELPDYRKHSGSAGLNIFIIVVCVLDVMYYAPQIRLALSFFGFGIWDVFSDIGGNYLQKDKLIEEIGQESLGLFYTVINLLSFAQVASYVLPVFRWKSINVYAKGAYVVATMTTIYFYISIGTMSGVFYVFILSVAGWLAGHFLGTLDSPVKARDAVQSLRRLAMYGVGLGFAFFLFMVYNLSSRATRLTLDLPLLYDDDSIVYKILGREMGDGFGLALAYVSHGWYGLGKSFEVDFLWTYGLASSRVVTAYYYRFAGIVSEPIPLSYPVRQENLTGFPPFTYWSTVFPWLASDFTFPGALILTALFGLLFAKVWITAIREGCVVSVSLFGLFSIAALFMNANPQVLDNKQLMLALVGLLALYPFRRVINNSLLG